MVSVSQPSYVAPPFSDPSQTAALRRAQEIGAVVVEPAPFSSQTLERFVFTHVPKTGGLTLRSIFAMIANSRQWQWEEILGSWSDIEDGALANYRARDPEGLKRANIVWGHLPYGFHGTAAAHVAILRDPLEQYTSALAMGLARSYYPPGMSPSDLVRAGYFTDNLQTRLLAGVGDHLTPDTPCTEEVFARACAHLNRYTVVADISRLNDFVAVMLRLLDAPPVLFFRRNTRPVQLADSSEAEFRECVGELSDFDTRLYKRIRDRVRLASPMVAPEPSTPAATAGGLAFYDIDGRNFVRYEDSLMHHVDMLTAQGIKVHRHVFDPTRLERF